MPNNYLESTLVTEFFCDTPAKQASSSSSKQKSHQSTQRNISVAAGKEKAYFQFPKDMCSPGVWWMTDHSLNAIRLLWVYGLACDRPFQCYFDQDISKYRA